MLDQGKPATGPLIMEQVVQLVSVMEDLRTLLETHTGAAADHRKVELRKIEDLHQDYHYYGDQLIRVYHDLNKNIQQLTQRIDRLLLTEDKAA